jgi:preprotein translocase subunit SecG
MYTLLTILIVILAVVLVLIVLVQNSKGGGLASSFSSSNQIMGVSKTTDFLEKTTWTLMGAIVVLSVLATAVIPQKTEQKSTQLSEEVQLHQQEAVGGETSQEIPGFTTPTDVEE